MPIIRHEGQILDFEFGPDVGSIPQDQLKEAGIEILIPQSKFRLMELSSDGNNLLVNLTSSSVEQFSLQMLGHGDSAWLIAGSGTEVILDIQGTSSLANIIADISLLSRSLESSRFK